MDEGVVCVWPIPGSFDQAGVIAHASSSFRGRQLEDGLEPNGLGEKDGAASSDGAGIAGESPIGVVLEGSRGKGADGDVDDVGDDGGGVKASSTNLTCTEGNVAVLSMDDRRIELTSASGSD